MKVNLHLHSKYSDGTLWPDEIVKRAKDLGLDQIALTDHDCMEGVKQFLREAGKAGLQAIAGVEIDCVAPEINYNSEVLGYFPEGNYTNTRNLCLERMQHREKRIKNLISMAAQFFGTKLSFEELKDHKLAVLPPGIKNPKVIYSKPDLFEYLKQKEIIAPLTDYGIFKKLPFLNQDKDPKPSVREVIDTILQDDGIPVLPHPGLIFDRDANRMKSEGKEIFQWFKDAGILALECNYYAQKNSDNTRDINDLVQKFAHELGLKVTWGSDCHGPGHHSDTMEKFWGTQDFPFPANRKMS